MLSYRAIQNKPHVFQSLTGLKIREFEQLLEPFEQAWIAYVEKYHIQGKTRQRGYGAGRKSQLDLIEDKLLFILVYFRLYPTQAVQGFLFGIGQPQAHEWVHKLSGVLNTVLGYEQQLPEREPHRLEAVLRQCPGLEFIIVGLRPAKGVGTERRINRPQDKDDQKQYYSGKKKAHTVQNNTGQTHRNRA